MKPFIPETARLLILSNDWKGESRRTARRKKLSNESKEDIEDFTINKISEKL
jgi:hypothetical protein